MYLKPFIFVIFLLFINFNEIQSQEEKNDETESTSTPETPSSNTSKQPDDTPSSEKGDEIKEKEDKEDKAKSDCPKTCNKNNINKYESQCTIHKHKFSEKAKTVSECIDICKKYAICVSALYVKPRTVTTLDLNTLYNRVIDHENWISVKDPTNPINLLDFHHKKNSNENIENTNEMNENKVFERFSSINSTYLKTNREITGFCYIFEEKTPESERLKCSPSQHHFISFEIECIEDQVCVNKRPRKICPRGKCGRQCRDFNTIHIPNACMAKYYFGHLEVDNIKSCLEFCSSKPNCKSVDLGNMGSCLINYVDRNDTQLIMKCDLKNNEIWDYFELKNDSECDYEKPKPSPNEDICQNVPGICKNGGNCHSVQLPSPLQSFSYDCKCPCNWCGKHCEHLNMKTYRNGCLNGSVIVWSMAENSLDCIHMCLEEIHCKSVSYSTTSGTCVLHWADQSTEQIVSSPNCPTYRTDAFEKEWTFFEIICNSSICHSSVEVIEVKEVKGCASSPCLNGGECADIYQRGKLIGYHCLCRCGFCGDRCERHNYVLTENGCIWKSHISDNPSEYYRNSSTLNSCLNFCASKFPICRSVDFSNRGECFLNNRDSDTSIVTEGCNNYMRQRWALYDLSCICNNKPVIY